MLDAIYIKPIESDIDVDIKRDIKRNSKAHQNESHLTATHTSEVNQKITFSIFEFKQLPDQKIAQYRHALFCPVCLQPAYFRRASSDGKQACFGSRHHLPDCSELNSHLRAISENESGETPHNLSADEKVLSSLHNEEQTRKAQSEVVKKVEEEDHLSIEKSVEEEQGFVIDFSAKTSKRKVVNEGTKKETDSDTKKANVQPKSTTSNFAIKEDKGSIKQSLPKLLTSLLRGSSLATSDVWVHTSEKHKWRAKNLFVKLEEADVVESGAPRMYWGTISYADKELLWLNVQGNKQVSIPVKLFKEKLLDKYFITTPQELSGASIILFAKCIESKDKSRRFLQLWSNDLQFLHLSLPTK